MSNNTRRTADWIIESVAEVNPYNRTGANAKSEYLIYNMGYLAAYLASMMEEDPFIAKRFKRHVESNREQQRKRQHRQL